MIPPQPVPTEFGLGVVPAQPANLIALQLQTPVGTHIVFFTVEGGRELVRQLSEIIPQASSGLLIPQPGQFTPPPLNGQHN